MNDPSSNNPPATPDPPDPVDTEALDALVEAAFDVNAISNDHLRDRAATLAALLALLDTPIPSSDAHAAADTIADSIRNTTAPTVVSEPELTPSAEDAVDAFVMAGGDRGRVPAPYRDRADHLATLLASIPKLAPTDEAWVESERDDRVAAVLNAVAADRERDALAPIPITAAPRRGLPNLRWNDVVAAASLLLIASAVFLPAINAMRASSMQAACLAHLDSTASGLGLYAGDHRDELPVASAGFAGSWMDVGTEPSRSNSANLYTMVRSDYATLEDLACPGNEAAPTGTPDPDARDWDRFEEVSFSYQILPGSRRPRNMLPSGSVVLTDRSPVMLRVALRQPVNPEANSDHHDARGQHVMRIDGSVAWTTSPVLAGGDNLWLPRSIETLLHTARTRVGLITGSEIPESPEDAFVGP